MAALNNLLRIVPDDSFALQSLIGLIQKDNQQWQTLTYLDRIIASSHTTGEVLASALRQAGEIRVHLGDFSGAENNFKRALEMRPGDPDLPLLVAQAERAKPGKEAISYAERAARAENGTNAGRAAAYLLAAEMRADLGDLAGAVKGVELALALAPEDLDALDAMVRLTRGKKSAALPFAEKAAQAAAVKPRWLRPAALRKSARIWLELDETSRAAESLKVALKLNPEDVTALGILVHIKSRLSPDQLAGLKRTEPSDLPAVETNSSSAEELSRALERNPNDLESLRALVALNRDRRRPAEASAYADKFLRAIDRAPLWQQAAAYRSLAALWISLGSEDSASNALHSSQVVEADSIETGLGLFPREREQSGGLLFIYCTAAERRLALGDRAGAAVLVKRGLALDPNYGWALRLKAEIDKIAVK